ncbi:MAG TPA: hypothetical protein VF086_05695 [Propionibacteriaceae bacterium]
MLAIRTAALVVEALGTSPPRSRWELVIIVAGVMGYFVGHTGAAVHHPSQLA